jgi:5-methylthioadenosine/S-adenosylhomocysteine deaminase
VSRADRAQQRRPVFIQGAQILSLDSGVGHYPRANILIEGQSIAAIGPDIKPPAGAELISADGMLAMPGLINAHFHSSGNLMRGQLDSLPLEIFMLREVPPLANHQVGERLSRIRTLLGAAEMLRNGITTVMDDAYHVPVATAQGIDAICAAYAEIGLRASVAIDQPNIVEYEKYPYLKEILPADLRQKLEQMPRQSDEELKALYLHLIEKWHGARNGLIHAAVSCSAPHRVTAQYLETLNRLSLDYQLPFNMHILETKVQRVFGAEKLGRSLVQYAAEHEILHRNSVVIHAIWVDDSDIATMAAHDVMIAHNPICNLRLGSGIAPYRKWRDAGCRVCLGTDEVLADDRISIFDAMKMTGLIHNLADPDWLSWPNSKEILEMAILGGADALGLKGTIGKLCVGYQADLILLDLDQYAFTPMNDLQRQLVYSESGQSVVHVFVAGQHVVRNRSITTIDEKALRAEARELMRELDSPAQESVITLEPYYRQMVLKAHAKRAT